jgi:exopolyphosphatase/guanosine-5'-triphosphate,3'-diphosphate pyrophosphatase
LDPGVEGVLFLEPFRSLAQRLDPDPAHSTQVALLAGKLFDGLKPFHELEEAGRILLEAAALCHDIGWSRAEKNHHKCSRDIILSMPLKDVDYGDRIAVALLARYHRKGVPRRNHKYYSGLSMQDQMRVSKLAAILRIADGLDSTHRRVVRELTVQDNGHTVILKLYTNADASREIQVVVKKKAYLFKQVYNRKLIVIEHP